MPHALVLHKSGAHRLACLSLYRALLRECSLLQLTLSKTSTSADESPPPSTLRNLVRYRFQRDRRLTSPTQVANGLKLASSCLDILQACNAGSPAALSKLTTLATSTYDLAESTAEFRAALAAARAPTSPKKLRKIQHLRAAADKASHTPAPGAGLKSILQRPLPLSDIKGGKRYVPYLVATHGIPFLRYPGTQPIYLGRYIRQARAWNLRTWALRDKLTDESRPLARWEDEWDEMMRSRFGVGPASNEKPTARDNNDTGNEENFLILDERGKVVAAAASPRDNQDGHEPRWTTAVDEAADELARAYDERVRTRADMGRKLYEVVLREREMAAREKLERKARRRAEKQAAAEEETQKEPLI